MWHLSCHATLHHAMLGRATLHHAMLHDTTHSIGPAAGVGQAVFEVMDGFHGKGGSG